MSLPVLTPDDCEVLALTRLHPVHRRRESHLTQTRWFDNRRLHPVMLTYLFAQVYVGAIRHIHSVTRDLEEARSLTVLRGEQDVFRRPDLLSFWRARQTFDRYGIPYRFGLRFVMERSALRGWTHYPQVNQLYSEDLVLDVRDAWQRRVRDVFTTAKDPFYRLVNDVGHPDQLAYRQWLRERINERSQPAAPLARCIREGQLSVQHARDWFGEEVGNKACAFAKPSHATAH